MVKFLLNARCGKWHGRMMVDLAIEIEREERWVKYNEALERELVR